MGKIIARVRERHGQHAKKAEETFHEALRSSVYKPPRVYREDPFQTPPEDRYRAVFKERLAICEALNLEPWADLQKSIIPAIQGLRLAQQSPDEAALGHARMQQLEYCINMVASRAEQTRTLMSQIRPLDQLWSGHRRVLTSLNALQREFEQLRRPV